MVEILWMGRGLEFNAEVSRKRAHNSTTELKTAGQNLTSGEALMSGDGRSCTRAANPLLLLFKQPPTFYILAASRPSRRYPLVLVVLDPA